MIQWFNTYASLITALATVVLAVITGVYAYLLRRQTKEYIEAVNNQTRESARPLLFISYPEIEEIIAVNVGKGPAYSIKIVNCEISFPLFPDDYGLIYFNTSVR